MVAVSPIPGATPPTQVPPADQFPLAFDVLAAISASFLWTGDQLAGPRVIAPRPAPTAAGHARQARGTAASHVDRPPRRQTDRRVGDRGPAQVDAHPMQTRALVRGRALGDIVEAGTPVVADRQI